MPATWQAILGLSLRIGAGASSPLVMTFRFCAEVEKHLKKEKKYRIPV